MLIGCEETKLIISERKEVSNTKEQDKTAIPIDFQRPSH